MAKRSASIKTAKAPAKAAEATAPQGGARGKAGRRGRGGDRGAGYTPGAAVGKHLVIVESPSKAKTINKYLGGQYVVLASVGHVRDLPEKSPKIKGQKAPPVPGVDLENNFAPTYAIVEGKERVISDLKRAAKDARSSGHEVWFATDLDREGEAIAWHLAQELGIASKDAKRVIFPAITKAEIEKAFSHPHPIDEDRVNAQQARRVLDRIVGYQVSPLLWRKVARGLSAGRVQSVAVRLIVEREREIRDFLPDEYWNVTCELALSEAEARKLAPLWSAFLEQRDEKKNPPTQKSQNIWLGDHQAIRAELVEVGGESFELVTKGAANATRQSGAAAESRITKIATLAGLTNVAVDVTEDPEGRGPARFNRRVRGTIDPSVVYKVTDIQTKRVTSRPAPPYITSTLQQAGSTRLGFGAQRTMRAAQQLYEGVEIPGEGPIGLITYMRTDSTHLSGEAMTMARAYITKTFGEKYLPEKPNFFSSSNKDAQEAHEAIRPTSLDYPPSKVRLALSADQLKLYTVIWERFVACQMAPAQWDSTSVTLKGGTDPKTPLTFRTSGRVLVFDGHYRVSGVPGGGDEQNLPEFKTGQALNALGVGVNQKFTQPPARYTEASLIKTLEAEGIGRPSTYASIISVIQDRKYAEQIERRFYATDLGEVVTDKLVEAFPKQFELGYTREMEQELDKVEEDHLDWIDMLRRFYDPFKKCLDEAGETLTHAKAEIRPAPEQYRCAKCGSSLVYRFGKNGRFLSCSTYPECTYAAPCDRTGKPMPAGEFVDVACHKCGSPMTKRTGKFGVFLGCSRYGDKANPCDGLLNLDKYGRVSAPSMPPLLTDLPCPKCEAPMNLRPGVRGPWLGCSRFPKCRGRGQWTGLEEPKRAALEATLDVHTKANRPPMIKTVAGKPLTDENGRPLQGAPSFTKPDQGAADGEIAPMPVEAEVA